MNVSASGSGVDVMELLEASLECSALGRAGVSSTPDISRFDLSECDVTATPLKRFQLPLG